MKRVKQEPVEDQEVMIAASDPKDWLRAKVARTTNSIATSQRNVVPFQDALTKIENLEAEVAQLRRNLQAVELNSQIKITGLESEITALRTDLGDLETTYAEEVEKLKAEKKGLENDCIDQRRQKWSLVKANNRLRSRIDSLEADHAAYQKVNTELRTALEQTQ